MDEDVIDLGGYARILRRQWLMVVAVTALVTAIAVGVSLLQTPLYAGEVELVIEPVRRSQDVTLEELLQRDETVETERRLITSAPVRQMVVEAVGGDADEIQDAITTSTVPNSRVVQVRATDTSPERAAELANATADAYLAFRRATALETLTEARSSIDQQIETLRTQLDEIGEQLEDTNGDGESTALEAERQSLLTALGTLVAQQSQLGGGDEVIGGGTIIDPATPQAEPVSPRPVRNTAIALLLGVMLGVAVALLRDHFDDRIRSEDDVRRAVGDRPIIGRIPVWESDSDTRLATLIDPRGITSEAYATLATNLKYVTLRSLEDAIETDGTSNGAQQPTHQRARVIVIISAGPTEGKTSTSANLAVASARAGRATLLLDADLRRPTIHKRFNLPNGRGLSDAISTGHTHLNLAQRIGSLPLTVLPSGPVPPNPADVVASRSMVQLVDFERGQADVIIIDSPPVLAVSDALELGHIADAVVLVVRPEFSHRRQLAAAVQSLLGVGVEVAGVVLNGVPRKRDAYGYGVQYEYGQAGDDEPQPTPSRRRRERRHSAQRTVDEPRGPETRSEGGLSRSSPRNPTTGRPMGPPPHAGPRPDTD